MNHIFFNYLTYINIILVNTVNLQNVNRIKTLGAETFETNINKISPILLIHCIKSRESP